MKKLSLILALVLVFTCGVLAACSEETEASSTADVESSEVKTESSATVEDSSEAEAESSEAVEEESSEEESKEPVAAGDTNLAAGKTYTAFEQFRQGGADAGWGWDDGADYAYPDENGASLVDGVIAATDSAYGDAVWAGWSGVHPNYGETGYAWVTLDLGEAADLAKFVAHLGSSGLGAGIGASNMVVSVAVSNDGETFEVVGEIVPEDDANSSAIVTTIELSEAVNAQYVQFRFVRAGWMFISELEVYGAAE